ncbi:MAG: hypothetical protein Ct9H300mP8_00090 [Gammaproteobacteria bacterium]|nr:MAG: hypothetical protein Ct9H300mP8_00090 [Gammaproteobacteria bacterium]
MFSVKNRRWSSILAKISYAMNSLGCNGAFFPIHAIVRVDEVEKEGTAKITDGAGATVTPFPLPMPDKKG